MPLTNNQRNIVNPNAPTLSAPEGSPVRSGVGYSYTFWRNRFVLDVIHESYNSYYEFPPSGFTLFPNIQPPQQPNDPPPQEDQDGDFRFPPLPDIDLGVMFITDADLLAYCALYPQNGKVSTDENGTSIIVSLSDEEANLQLNAISNSLRQVNNYYTETAPLSYDPENTESRYRLVTIDPGHSAEYIARLRRALGKENQPLLNADPSLTNTILPPDITSYISSNTTVDLDNWVTNCDPGTETIKTYYNSRDSRFYYTERTNHTSPDYYDLSYYDHEDQEDAYNTVKNNLERALEKGVVGILKAVGKFSRANQNSILNVSPKKAYILTHLDVRPASRWCYSVQINRDIVDALPAVETMSYEEEELWVLEKAQTLASPEKTPIAHRKTFIFDDLIDYIRSTQQMLELLSSDMAEEGIFSLPLASSFRVDDPEARSGLLFLEDEIARLNGFPDFMQTFFAYNKKSLLPETVIELYFDEQYRLLHICANGELLSRGLGNINYIKREDDAPVGKILNAFSFLTSTTFSYILHSPEIHEKFLMVAPGGVGTESGEEWTTFLPQYTYPQVIIDPEAIKIEHEKNSILRRRKKTLFQRLSRVLDVPADQAEKLYQAKINDKKWVRQRVTELVKGVNCSTAQAQLANDIVGFWNAANEKNNVRAIIRESIQLLRRELSNDAVTSIAVSAGITGQQNVPGIGEDVDWVLGYANRMNQQLDLEGSRNPNATLGQNLNAAYNSEYNRAQLTKQVEEVINDQIFCAIDSFGNVLQNGFLDPVGIPPSASRLITREIHKPLTIKLSKVKTISMKKDQSEIYMKMIDTAIQQLLKSLVTGIARDVFAAALGCAPNPSQTDQLDNSLKRYDFGYSMLSEHVGPVNLREVAMATGLVTPPLNEAGDPIPPTPEQMQAFLRDISIMCTPAELQQLLFGEADNVLYDLIYETVSKGVVRVKTGEEEDDNGDKVPIYHIINPQTYASLTKTKDIIREFFAAVGDALIPGEIDSVDDLSFQSPLEAYCAGKDPDVTPLRLRIGVDQIQSQYIQVMDARINKINNLCQWLQDLSNIEAMIGDIFDFVPVMDWYNNILELLAMFSNFIASAIAELWASWFDEDPPHSSAPDIQNIYNTRMGAELFFQIREELTRRPQHTVATTTGFDGPVYILGGSNGLTVWSGTSQDPGYVTDLGNPYIEDNEIKYEFATLGSTRQSTQGRLQLPYQPANDFHDINVESNIQVGYYSARVAPFSFRERLLPSLSNSRLNDTNTALDYGIDVIYKIARQSWTEVPYTGFVSPIYLSSRSIANGGYTLSGIKVNSGGSSYEELASWNPGILDSESNPDSGQPLDGTNAVLSYAISSIGWDDNNDYRPDLVTKLPSINNNDLQRLLNWYFGGYIAPGQPYIPEEDQPNILPLVSIANWTTTTERQLNSSYYNEIGKRRMPQYVNAINRDALKVLDDKCVTRDDARKAHAILKVVQSRMQKFFLNAMITASAYPNWNNLSTRKLVCDYLSKNVVKELTARSILGLVYENMDFVKKVYADEPENNFTFSESNTPYLNLVEFVEAIYVGMLNNIAKYSEYEQINKNAYSYYSTEYVEKTGDDNITVDRYDLTLRLFFQHMLDNLREGTSYGLRPDEVIQAIDYIEGRVLQGDNIKNIGNYYFPLGVLTATQLIYADYSLNTAGRYSQTNYRLELEEAGADDGLLTAFRGLTTSQFSVAYRGFPQTITTYTQDNEITYYNTHEVERRLVYINGIVNNVGDLVDNYEAIDFSPRQFVDMSFQDFEQFILPAIESYMEESDTGLFGFNDQGETSLNFNFSYEEGFDLMVNRWYEMLTARERGGRFVGNLYHDIFGDSDRTLTLRSPNGTITNERLLSTTSAYLNISQDVNPSIYTPSEYYEAWITYYQTREELERTSRVGQNIDRDASPDELDDMTPTQLRDRFMNSSEYILANTLVSIYESAQEEAITLENIRTERNSLEKLIIE